MTREGHRIRLRKEQLVQGAALCLLLFLAGLAIAGPSGLLAWSENSRLLEQRNAEVVALVAERDRLQNLVDLLNPEQADPDLVGELLRQNQNMVHPDEVVLTLPESE